MSARWPSRYPVWTLGALGVAALLFCAQLWVQYAREWSEAERVYLSDYLRSGIRGSVSARGAGAEAVCAPEWGDGPGPGAACSGR
jgi:hypothetical protein